MRHWLSAKRRPSRSVILALLILQLVLAFQLQAVQAVASPVSMEMAAAHGKPDRLAESQTVPMSADIAAHGDAVADAADKVTGAVDSVAHAALADTAAAVVDDDSAAQPDCHGHSTPHECCHAGACQCHCVYTPGVIDSPALSNIATSVAIPFRAATQFVAPRIDEFLRPPIA